MDRRTLLKTGISLATIPLLSRVAWACDGHVPKKAPSASENPWCQRMVARIGRNHGHVFQVSLEDVKAAVSKTYDLTGTSTHGHSVTLSVDDFKRLGQGDVVRIPSSQGGGHLHRLLVTCAPAVDPPESINVCEIVVGGKDEHEFVITAMDMAAKVDKTYDIQGISSHSHSLQITSADFDKLLRGDQVAITSSISAGHTHVVFVRYPVKKAGAT